MGNDIRIGVSADFDGSGVDAGLAGLTNRVNQANRTQYNPISDKALKQIEQANKAFQQLLRVDTDLKRRAKSTGQGGATFENFNWEAAYPNQAHRERKKAAAAAYVNNPGSYAGPGGGGGGGGHGFAANAAASAAQAGLRATGPAGGVAAGAIGTGMSSGFGAGLMGLMGGMLALGVGKLVGSAMEKVEQAEKNSVALDTLKRTLGDVNVSFAALKSVVNSGADNLKITYEEAGRLSTQFAKLGNLSGDQYKSLAGELDVGVGMSRSFGMDPSQGMDAMGQMRGVGMTSNTTESRKFALLIGETIGKSNAFAKAGEVMEALAGFATSQTRQSMSRANVDGYAGMLSSMVGSGIPGMDVAGSSNMLARMNSALAGGGAKGEASQFFTGMVGSRMGLDPLQTQVMREGGMFATNNGMFGTDANGKDSAYKRYMGHSGPTGNATFLSETKKLMEEKYAGDTDSQKLLRAQAFGNHTGLNMNQSMAMLTLQPNEMGELAKLGDISKVSGTGIGNMAKAMSGTNADRDSIKSGLLGRTGADAISSSDRSALEGMKGDIGDKTNRELLARMSSQYDQERTTGSDIRDSKAALDNIKTNMADKLVPLMQEMRHGIMYMAGGKDGKSPMSIMKDVVNLESKDKQNGIKGAFEGEREKAMKDAYPGLIASKTTAERMANRAALSEQLEKLNEKEAAAIKAELAERDILLEKLKKQNSPMGADPVTGRTTGDFSRMDRGSSGGGQSGSTGAPGDKKATAEAMKFFTGKGWSEEQAAGIVANLSAESGLNAGAVGDGGKAFGVAQWHPDRQAAFKKWAGKDIQDSSREEQYGFVHHEMTDGNEKNAGEKLRGTSTKRGAADAVSRYYERPKFTELEAVKRGNMAENIGTPLPTDVGAGGGRGSAESYRGLMLQADPIVVEHRNERGEQVRPSQSIAVSVRQASPFGTERFA